MLSETNRVGDDRRAADGFVSTTKRLLGGLTLVTVTLFAAYSGILSVLLPRQIAAIDPDGKVIALAIVTSVSFAATATAQPILGALSDRTRSRWGRRIPWMITGAVVGAVAMGVAGAATSVFLLAVAWAVGQFALNGTGIASSAYIVDRFVPRRRGGVAALLGGGAIVGGASGAMIAGQLTRSVQLGYWIFAVSVVAAVLVFAIVVRDGEEPRDTRRSRQSIGEFFRRFWVSPRLHPNFARVFGWKLCITLSYGAVHGFMLYLLTGLVGLDVVDAAAMVGVITVIGGVSVLIGVVVGGWGSDKLGRRKPFLLIGGGLVVVGDIAALVFSDTVGILILAVALGVALGLSVSCGTALGSEVIPDPELAAARGLGLLNIATNAGQTIAPVAAAAAITMTGGYQSVFVISIVAAVIATALISLVREDH